MPRMNILNAVEQEAFESAPVFNSFQRKQYFDFPQAIQQAAASLRTPANQLCFLLSCGYFKASKRFFPTRTFHPRDVEYVAGRTGLRLEEIELNHYPKETSSRHRGIHPGLLRLQALPSPRPPRPCRRNCPSGAVPDQTQGHLLALCRCPGPRENRSPRLFPLDQSNPECD